MAAYLQGQPIGWQPCVQTTLPTFGRAVPVVVIILVLAEQLLTRVELSLILGG